MFGLRNSDVDEIIRILGAFPEVDEAWIYGSRAKGNFKQGSDVDIAVKGKNLSYSIIREISYYLNEETLMPYHFDILNYHTLNNQQLTEHIDRVGKLLFRRSESDVLAEEQEIIKKRESL